VVARDAAGNTGSATWGTRLLERGFPDEPITLSRSFLEQKVSPLAAAQDVATGDPIEDFRKVNTELRAANEARLRELLGEGSSERLWSGAFEQMPNTQVTSRFAERRRYTLDGVEISRAIHYGYDLAATASAPIPAANAGRVIFADELGIYGNCVLIDHGLGVSSLYGHLSSFTVSAGDAVEKGQIVGRSGQTGLAGGDHLHFAILVGDTYVDPVEWWDPKWMREHVEGRLAPPPPEP
jgi:murein DD-endopeptidase MepM/ murein hydrolase activator NlpD